MNLNELIKKYQNMTETDIEKIIKNKIELLNLSTNEYNLLFLNVNNNCKKILLDDLDLFKKTLNIPPNRMKKTILDLVSDEIKEYIYNHTNLLNSKECSNTLLIHLKKLNEEEREKILYNKNLNSYFSLDSTKLIKEKFNLSPYEYCTVKQEIISNNFSPLALVFIKNKEELFIYAKFHILTNIKEINNDILKIDDKEISYQYLQEVNKKHINSLIELAKKTNKEIKNNELLIAITKLYMVFGLDNSKKILNNFFTYKTESSLKRASEELLKDTRRAYRLEHQDKFYYYGMEDRFEKEYMNNNIEFFKQFCETNKEEYIKELLKKIEKAIKEENKTEQLKQIIIEEINRREKEYQETEEKKYIKYFNTLARTKDITINDLYHTFSNINIKYNMTKDGKIIPDPNLTKVLLGNSKKDNDCLLRMAWNKEAFGLNNELYQIINHFDEIEAITKKNPNLSIYSILDLIDISKTFLYNLKPDELDITLETLSKILNSRKYCTESPETILERTMNLHKERKFKISCAVPLLTGQIKDITYRIIPPYDESLLVSGIDTGSCFKVGGKGEDFFHYCLTSPLGFVLEINKDNINYILPSTVNGNMININSIDPKIEEEATYKEFLEIIKQISNQLIEQTKTIEIVTMTDIHHEEKMSQTNLQPITIEKFIPLNTDVYCDYNKKEVKNYIRASKNNITEPKYFDNKERYLIERYKPYIITPSKEYDKERINQLLNQIAYSCISFENIKEEDKKIKKEYYKELDIENFQYIVGNMDWFIGIDKNNNILEYVLPFDKRGTEEYRKYKGIIYQYILNNKYRTKKR